MESTHRLHIGDARRMAAIADASVHLVVTSPPYPMIGMWDTTFAALAPGTGALLEAAQGFAAFEAMHTALDEVWAECARVLVPGGFACINIGDATRTVGDSFCLYPNHARILTAMVRLGFTPLPDILWRKPTNAPNKFMGSGMLPAGAYVTYEHEYVLIVRKGDKREFDAASRARRAASAFFWEERNVWFSDVWTDLRGVHQRTQDDTLRARSAAFPFELPYRLVNMYALQGDTVLDPFAGTGTTLAAALAAGRSSVGYEYTPEFRPIVEASLTQGLTLGAERVRTRLAAHRAFVQAREADGKPMKHTSSVYGFPVMTSQEVALRLLVPRTATERSECLVVTHDDVVPEAPVALVGRGNPAPPIPATPQPSLFGALIPERAP